jgi:hypothetical protein
MFCVGEGAQPCKACSLTARRYWQTGGGKDVGDVVDDNPVPSGFAEVHPAKRAHGHHIFPLGFKLGDANAGNPMRLSWKK